MSVAALHSVHVAIHKQHRNASEALTTILRGLGVDDALHQGECKMSR